MSVITDYKELIANAGVNDTNPVLIMYFAKNTSEPSKLFAIPSGILSNNAISVNNRPNALNTANAVWFAKFYVYIMPSTADNYLFKITGTGDARLYLNNTIIIDAWSTDGSEGTATINKSSPVYINLSPTNGPYLLYVEYRYKNASTGVTIPNFSVTYNKASSTTQSTLSTSSTTAASTLYMSKFSPYVITEDARKSQSITYCKTSDRFATDDFCVGTSNNQYTGVNAAYGTGINDYDFQKQMIDYCRVNNKFANDNTFCANNDKKLSYVYKPTNNVTDTALELAMYDYCNNTSNASANNTYCKATDNYNTNNHGLATSNMHPNYAKQIRDGRLINIQRAISDSLASTTAQGEVSQDVINYITTDYPNIQSKFSSTDYPVSNIVTPTLSQYCEFNQDSNSALCNTIYGDDANNIYKTDSNITASKERKDKFKLAIDSKAFMGVSTDVALNSKYKLERDSQESYARYLPFAVNYCSTGDNIKNSECQEYYNNIQDKIQSGLNKQYDTPTVSSFANVSTFTNKEPYCNNRYNEDNYSCDNSNNMFMFLMFIFVIIFIMSLSGSYNGMNKYYRMHTCNRRPYSNENYY